MPWVVFFSFSFFLSLWNSWNQLPTRLEMGTNLNKTKDLLRFSLILKTILLNRFSSCLTFRHMIVQVSSFLMWSSCLERRFSYGTVAECGPVMFGAVLKITYYFTGNFFTSFLKVTKFLFLLKSMDNRRTTIPVREKNGNVFNLIFTGKVSLNTFEIWGKVQFNSMFACIRNVSSIRIRRIRLFLGHLDLLVTSTDPDTSLFS